MKPVAAMSAQRCLRAQARALSSEEPSFGTRAVVFRSWRCSQRNDPSTSRQSSSMQRRATTSVAGTMTLGTSLIFASSDRQMHGTAITAGVKKRFCQWNCAQAMATAPKNGATRREVLRQDHGYRMARPSVTPAKAIIMAMCAK